MKQIEIKEIYLIEKPVYRRVEPYDLIYNSRSFNFTVSEKHIKVFGQSDGMKKAICIEKNGNIVQNECRMLAYHIGDDWVKLEGCFLSDKEFNEDYIRRNIKLYKY